MAASSDCFAELGLLVNLWALPQAILRWTYASITITEVAFFRDVERLVVDADEARLSTIIALPRSILQLCSLRFGKRRFVLAWRQWSGPSLLETLLDLLVVRLKYELWFSSALIWMRLFASCHNEIFNLGYPDVRDCEIPLARSVSTS